MGRGKFIIDDTVDTVAQKKEADTAHTARKEEPTEVSRELKRTVRTVHCE